MSHRTIVKTGWQRRLFGASSGDVASDVQTPSATSRSLWEIRRRHHRYFGKVVGGVLGALRHMLATSQLFGDMHL